MPRYERSPVGLYECDIEINGMRVEQLRARSDLHDAREDEEGVTDE